MKRIWLAAAVLVTLCFGVGYTAIQQALRLGANDPQISMAQDTATAIKRDNKLSDLLSGRIEMAYSMAPFIIVYDKMGNVVTGNGLLNSEIPVIPIGVLQHTPALGTHAVTWQPAAGVRIAAVSAGAGQYYVVSGRSLTVAEEHIQSLTQYTLCMWLVVMVGLGAAYIMVNRTPAGLTRRKVS
ncbi:MAG TPA: hypothetical protein VGO07_02790 [Candidatus Saccharimonadales bacterium]|jgi:hypothetical protein|nr:hypothetical protein [Candidatus Saccharimonadales bacterium]